MNSGERELGDVGCDPLQCDAPAPVKRETSETSHGRSRKGETPGNAEHEISGR